MSESVRKARPGGLGRGLSALLGDAAPEDTASATGATTGLRMLPVSALEPHPEQPRRAFDDTALEELAASVATRGIIQPIVVRPHGQSFQIVAGERRWRAAQRARLHEVPVIVREFDDNATLEVALLENIQRQDLNAIEEADAYRKLLDAFGHTQESLGRVVHKSRSHIANLLRLLELPPAVQQRVIDGSLSMGHARALIGAEAAESLAEQVIARGLSVRDTEKLARGAKPARAGGRPAKASEPGQDGDIAALEQHLGDVLGLKVTIGHAGQGGTISIAYSSLDQLDLICQRLSGERF